MLSVTVLRPKLLSVHEHPTTEPIIAGPNTMLVWSVRKAFSGFLKPETLVAEKV